MTFTARIALAWLMLLTFTWSTAAAVEAGADLKARTYFAAGEYRRALDIYAQLYAETLHPTYLRNIGRCHQNLGAPDKAITSFREYLRKVPDLAAPQRAEIEGYIGEMEQLKRASAVAAAVPPAAVPAPEASAAVVGLPTVTAPDNTDSEARPVYTRVWFWAVVVGAAAGITTAVLLSADRGATSGNAGLLDLRDKPR